MLSQKFTKMTCFVPIIRHRLGTLLCLLVFSICCWSFCTFSQSGFVDTSAFFYQSETTSLKQFSLNIFLFCNLHSKMSRNMCKWHHKVRIGPILPPWSLKFRIYVFQSLFNDNLSHFFKKFRPHNQNSFFYTVFLFVFYSKLQDIYKHV